MKTRQLLLILCFAAVTVGSCGLLGSANSDQATLDQLREAGSDLSKPHPFDFYLYHPEQSGAELLCSALQADGLRASVSESAIGGDWLCLASYTMLPTMDNLTAFDERFSQLIDQYGGEYDGWETIVIP